MKIESSNKNTNSRYENTSSNKFTDKINTSTRVAIDLLSSDEIRKLSSFSKKPKQHSQLNELLSDGVDSPCSSIKSSVSTTETIDSNVDEIHRALYKLVNQENINLYAQIELLLRFDELQGWKKSGAKSCAAWMNSHLQIDNRTAWERLRVGRKLRELPLISASFKAGRLSWSKVRILTRVATPENEAKLMYVAIDATVSDVQRICEEYRWSEDEYGKDDIQLAEAQLEHRTFTWKKLADGCIRFTLILPPEQAQNYLHAIEHCEELVFEDHKESLEQRLNVVSDSRDTDSLVTEKSYSKDVRAAQRKADAAVMVAERSIAYRGAHVAPADRYQVVLNVDCNSLRSDSTSTSTSADDQKLVRKPYIEGIGSVPVSTAKLISCDCSIIGLLTDRGEPLSVGRKQRMWPPSMRRAILTRDRHCQFPGCSSHRFLHIHHIKHWADGGETSSDNAVCLCHYHHQLVHNEKYNVERAKINNTTGGDTTGLYPRSKLQLLPTRCRFIFSRPSKSIIKMEENTNIFEK